MESGWQSLAARASPRDEGMIGVSALLGMDVSALETIVQLDGSGRRIRAAVLGSEMDQSPAFRELVLRSMYYAESRISQAAACNRLHTMMQRCCRWLLTAADNVRSHSFDVRQDALAISIGVNRPSLSLTLSALERARITTHKRGTITILDRGALEERSCECYDALRQEGERVYSS